MTDAPIGSFLADQRLTPSTPIFGQFCLFFVVVFLTEKLLSKATKLLYLVNVLTDVTWWAGLSARPLTAEQKETVADFQTSAEEDAIGGYGRLLM